MSIGRLLCSSIVVAAVPAAVLGQTLTAPAPWSWETVVNNATGIPGTAQLDGSGNSIPGTEKRFSSYNQPSVNGAGLVVFRARSTGKEGGGEEATLLAASTGSGSTADTGPVKGIFTRAMAGPTGPGPVTMILRNGHQKDSPDPLYTVPWPNDIAAPGPAVFNEFPSIPRIDLRSGTIATRGQSTPVYEYQTGVLADGTAVTTRIGSSGIYANPLNGEGNRPVMTAVSLLGAVKEYPSTALSFPFWQVPGAPEGTRFDQFPGAPGVAGPNMIVFKGNWTDPGGVGRTGVYYRGLSPDPSNQLRPVIRIADSYATPIPGSDGVVFGSTAPPSGAAGKMVFVGLDDEAAPRAGGVYLAPLSPDPALRPLAQIGGPVPGFDGKPIAGAAFKAFGEGLSFDGRFVAFWGAWGSATRKITLACPKDGNAAMIQACTDQDDNVAAPPDGSTNIAGDGIYVMEVPVDQGFFVYDTRKSRLYMVARTGTASGFLDFLFWNFSGRPPGTGGGDEPTLEPPRWRSNAFSAVNGPAANDSRVAFKALKADGTIGLYMVTGPKSKEPVPLTLVDTKTPATVLDQAAPTDPLVTTTPLYVTALGLERDGFRSSGTEEGGSFLVVNASMANADASVSWAGVYLTRVPNDDDEHDDD